MRRPVHLALILCLVLTGIGLGAARGTVMLDGQIVLCTGEGVVVISDPANPDRAHLCPDMALSLLSALPGASLDLVLSSTLADLDLPIPQLHAQGRESISPAARGPPSWQISETKPA